MQSDNFQTFHQAGRFLQSVFEALNWKAVQQQLATEHIRWAFFTERAPWCGGYWERMVRSVKVPLRKTVGRSLLIFDELQTVLCEVEARINDRPLTLVSSGAQDKLALTPVQFLIRRSLAALPEEMAERQAPA
ncbi:hypothetical protein T11_1034 [Trichinella zimbabwensis]|uniref:Integrase catalytic domain-containing protein n=1 Tax=Trichinella zimbabwensis TaxID=268475 RepID=A0A0V1HLG7_9BILA|nr:hypothetical protein T11_1034 [Trichinella zimbabwensis]